MRPSEINRLKYFIYTGRDVYKGYIPTVLYFFFALNFKIEMTVECPGAQKLKRISQKMFLSREKIKKNENFNFHHRKNAN